MAEKTVSSEIRTKPVEASTRARTVQVALSPLFKLVRWTTVPIGMVTAEQAAGPHSASSYCWKVALPSTAWRALVVTAAAGAAPAIASVATGASKVVDGASVVGGLVLGGEAPDDNWPPAVTPPTGATAATVAGRSSEERRLAVIRAGSATMVSARAMMIRVRSCESTTLRAPPSCEVDLPKMFRRIRKL